MKIPYNVGCDLKCLATIHSTHVPNNWFANFEHVFLYTYIVSHTFSVRVFDKVNPRTIRHNESLFLKVFFLLVFQNYCIVTLILPSISIV